MNSNRVKGVIGAAGLALALVAGAACGGGATPEPSAAGSVPILGAQSPLIGAPSGQSVSSFEVGVGAAPQGFPAFSGASMLQASNGQTGIWVTGTGVVTVEPDLVVMTVGVDSSGKTVAEANGKAADAMDAITSALRDRGLDDRDIQTVSFNIFPQYEYQDVVELGTRRGKQVLVGYRVTNNASIKIRDLDSVGEIVDEVAQAGGDDTRINGISFTVENPAPMRDALREAAVGDALAKAQQFASLTGAGLGQLVFISESGGSAPIVRAGAPVMAFAESAGDFATTPVSGGELELRLNVQAAFAIQ